MQSVNLNLPPLDRRSSEAYKTLRANLQFCGSDIKVIAVTSCTPNEGKSTVTLNLAKALADSGKKVILVDADLRKSVLIGRMGITEATLGFSHYLSGQRNFNDVVYATDVNNLHIVFAGPVPPNPSELLGNRFFKYAVEKLKEIYDYVLIDTPPLGSVIDSAVVAANCDGSILVLSANEISYRFAKKVLDQLRVAECPVLGTILNKVDITNSTYGRYYGRYYGKYYGKYYGNYAKKADKYLDGES